MPYPHVMLTLEKIVSDPYEYITDLRGDGEMFSSIAGAVQYGTITERQFKAINYIIRKNISVFANKFDRVSLMSYLDKPVTRATIRLSSNHRNTVRFMGNGFFGLLRQTNHPSYRQISEIFQAVRSYRIGEVSLISETEFTHFVEDFLKYFTPDEQTLDYIELITYTRENHRNGSLDYIDGNINILLIGSDNPLKNLVRQNYRAIQGHDGVYRLPATARLARSLRRACGSGMIVSDEFEALANSDPYPEEMSEMAKAILDHGFRISVRSAHISKTEAQKALLEAVEYDGNNLEIVWEGNDRGDDYGTSKIYFNSNASHAERVVAFNFMASKIDNRLQVII